MRFTQGFTSTAAIVAFFLMPAPSRADIVALTVTPTGAFDSGGDTAGWSFDLDRDIVVTALGVFDYAFDGVGLAESHDVGIWTDAGVLVASATVPSGTADDIQVAAFGGTWRFVSVATPITLDSGTYRIGAYYTTSADAFDFGDLPSTSPYITYGSSYDSDGGSLAFPTTGDGAGGIFGPNFEYLAPEPGSLILFATGLVLLCRWRVLRTRY